MRCEYRRTAPAETFAPRYRTLRAFVPILQGLSVNIETRATSILLACLAAAGVSGCGKKESSTGTPGGADAPVVRIDGSSTVFPIAEAVAEEFQGQERGAIRVLNGKGGKSRVVGVDRGALANPP